MVQRMQSTWAWIDCRSSSEKSLVVAPKASGAKFGEMEMANSKMAEELEKVNSDLAQALKGLQEVRRGYTFVCAAAYFCVDCCSCRITLNISAIVPK